MKNYTNQELIQKNLSNLSFIKKKLIGKSFKNSKLHKCDFWEAQLAKSNFEFTEIKNCIFTDSNLKKANFRNSLIQNSNFSHCNLLGVNFSNTKIKNVNFRDAIFDNTTIWPKNFNLKIYSLKKNNNFKKKKPIFKIPNTLVNKIVKALTKGKGYYVLKNYFEKNKIIKAQKILKNLVLKDKKITKTLKLFEKDKKFSQKWIINLLNIDPVFVELIQPEIAMRVFEKTLGKDFICGFYEANCLLPGARGQFPHIDYPYNYNYEYGQKIPFTTNGNFLFNCQILVPLNDIDKSNGSTAFLDYSYKFSKFPKKENVKNYKFKQISAPAGSLVLFNGLTWHKSMPNYSYTKERYCTLGQYIPHFIKPMIDIRSTTEKKIYTKDKKYLGQLLGLKSKFPFKKK